MASGYGLVALGSLSAFACAACGFPLVLRALGRRTRSTRLQRRAGSLYGVDRFLQNGFPGLVGISRMLLSVPLAGRYASRACEALRLRSIGVTHEGLASSILGLAALCVLVSSMFGRPEFGFCGVICAVALLHSWANRVSRARTEAMRAVLPEALSAMSGCFGAGYTLPQTFEHLGRELQGPLASLFGKAADEMKTGNSYQAVLDEMRRSSRLPELSFVAVALSVQHQTGGSMQQVLEIARESLKQELEMRRSLQVHTAQARLSARVVSGVTLALVCAMAVLSQDFLRPFFESMAGLAMLLVALSMQLAGIMLVRRLLNVEVS